jgi:TonB family protein
MPDKEYITQIQQKISSALIYPTEAKLSGWEGVVLVRFIINQDGQIKELNIAKSSGYPLLDEAAMAAVKNASPYPSLKLFEQIEKLEITLPINFKQGEQLAFSEDKLINIDFDQETLDIEPIEEILFRSKSKPTTHQAQELNNFIELAIQNNQPTQIAQQEVELAKLKIREAKRNIFPVVKLTGYFTDGEVFNVAYREGETRIQLDQPIFYGGRLRNSINQAEVNLEITKGNFDRIVLDVAHKAEVAYYNLVASRMNLEVQEKIRQQAREILNIIQKQFSAELITSLEVSSAQSWFKQINFQIDSTRHDFEMAKLTFMQVLNLSEPIEISPHELKINNLKLSLEQCIDAGLKNRPEIYLSELLVQFNELGEKIEQAKNNFTVDFTSAYGRYQGAFKTEELQDSDNWQVGIKATKPWGPSTFTSSATTEELQPRFGQTSPTKASTISAEFNLFDNFQRLSDQKEVEISLARSLSDLNETVKTIEFEVRDAYLNYQKALLQASTAQTEAEYRRRQVEVLKVRAQTGDGGFSNIMEALVNLSRAQTNFTQALANYYIFLANLKKATGYGVNI